MMTRTPVKDHEEVLSPTLIYHRLSQRQDDLRAAEARRVDDALKHMSEMVALRAEHFKDMGALETNRLNAIRNIDVLAVNTAAEKSSQAIAALATQTATNAEVLRNALTTTAMTIAKQNSDTVGAITDRIGLLEKSMYEGRGKQEIADPALTGLVAKVETLLTSQSEIAGRTKGNTVLWGYIVGAVGMTSSLMMIVVLLLKAFGKA
jgi:hypothetical protein